MESTTYQIRPLHPDDAADMYRIATLPAVAENTTRLPSMEFGATAEFVQQHSPHHHRFVAVQNGRVAGAADLRQFTNPRLAHIASLGIMVDPEVWGQGVGTALMAKLLDLADNWLNLRRVELQVFTDNAAAVHLYKKFDFKIEGTQRKMAYGPGRWRDGYLMARLHQPEPVGKIEIPPPQPRPDLRLDDIDIRPPRAEVAETLVDTLRHPLVAQTTAQLPSLEPAAYRERSEKRSSEPGLHRFLAVHNDRAIGWVNLHQYQQPRRMHVGYLGIGVHPDYWGIGLGTKLMQLILDLADNWLNLRRVELDVNVDNPVAVRLYEKLGFETEGTRRMHIYGNSRWADSYFMARLR